MKMNAAFAACFAAACTLTSLPAASAMSVRPPSFPELVAEASTVVRAHVAQVVSLRVDTAAGPMIKTYVTFDVSRTLKGAATPKLVLAFLGGEVDGHRLDVPGMPQFQKGAEEYLFVAGKPSICPLIGAMYGRFRVLTAQKEGRPYVARDDGSQLVQLGEIPLPMHSTAPQIASVTRAISPDAFEAAIAAEVAHPSPSASAP